MHLIVGLGNPGEKYANTRHNIGFMAVDALHHRHSFANWSEKFSGLTAKGEINGKKTVLLKPQTYMNLSGKSVQAAAAFYKIPPQNIFVIHDEIDLASGKLKIKQGGGDAGHNGLKSISGALGKDYTRIRFGIDRPERREQVSGYVLAKFTKAELVQNEKICNILAEVFPQILAKKNARALNDMALALAFTLALQ